VRVTAQNPYTNYTFSVNLDFYKDKNDDEDEKKKEEILWILIVAIGGIMIIGLIIAFARQQRRLKEEALQENKQTLLTVDDDFKNNYIDINRSSADPLSVRESVEPTITKERPQDEEEYFTH
jgi:NAD/NADP transhydrogenase beta subunit